jgi:hypothetical protein
MAMQLKTGADLNNMPLSRFVIENLSSDPENNIKEGSKYYNSGSGTNSHRERIYSNGKWRSTAYMDDIDALQKQLDELDFAGSEEFQTLSGRVLTIEGLFNNGKAKDAEKLGGQLPSYYATADGLSALQQKVNAFLDGEVDSDSVLENLKEIQAFLDSYDGATSLAEIIDSINTQIADRYTKAESDGRYLPLDGTKAMSGVLEAPKGIKIGNVVISIDNDGNLKIDGNAYATGELGSGQVAGEGGGGSTGGGYTAFDDSVTWADYNDSMADWLVTAYHGKLFNDRIATLENKATKVEVSNLLTSGTKIATIKVDANSYDILAPSTDWSAITNKPTTIGGYGITDAIKYNTAGIDISGDTMPLNEIGYGYISKGWIGNGVAFSIGLTQNYWMNLQYNSAYQGLAHRACIDGTIRDWANILDEKNYKYFLDTVYLKQSGGNINGPLSVSSEWPMIVFVQNGVRGESIGVNQGKLVCYNAGGTNSYEILHLNNYANHAAKKDGSNASGTWKIDITGKAASAYKLISSNGATVLSTDGNQISAIGDIGFTNAGQGLRWTVGDTSIANIVVGTTGNFLLGNQGAQAGYNTYLDGNNIYLRYGRSNTVAMTITEEGNVEIAGVNNAYTRKLAVGVGSAHIVATTTGLPLLGTPATGSFLVGSVHYGLQIGTNTIDEASFIQAQRFNSADAKKLNLNPLGGDVHIGSASTSSKLHVSEIQMGTVTLKVENGALKVVGNVFATGEVASGKIASSGGEGEEGGSGTIGGTLFSEEYDWSNYTSEMKDWLVTAYHGKLFDERITTLETKPTNVRVGNRLTSGKTIATIGVDNAEYNVYAPATYAWSEITGTENVLTTAGGVIDGVDTNVPLKLNGNYSSNLLVFSINNTSKMYVGYSAEYGSVLFDYAHGYRLGITTQGKPAFNNDILLHQGNFADLITTLNKNVTFNAELIGKKETGGSFARWRIATSENGTFFQAGSIDSTKAQGILYLSGINGTYLEKLNILADLAVVSDRLHIGHIANDDGSALQVNGNIHVTGNIRVANDYGVLSRTTTGGTIQIIGIGASNLLSVGSDACIQHGVATNIYGKDIRYIVGNSLDTRVTAMTITNKGNVLVGATSNIERRLVVGTGGAFIYAHTLGGDSTTPTLGNVATNALLIGYDSYGTQIWTNSNGYTFIQSGRFDGTATAYALNLNPLGGSVSIGNENSPVKINGRLDFTNSVATINHQGRSWAHIENSMAYIGTSAFAPTLSLGGYSIMMRAGGNLDYVMLIDTASARPYSSTAPISLGTSSYRWSNVYSVNGNFSGEVSIGGNIIGNSLYLANNSSIAIRDTNGANITILNLNTYNEVAFCYSTISKGYKTDIYGHEIRLFAATENSLSAIRIDAGGIIIPTSHTLKIGEATLSYEDGALKVDKNFFAEGEVASGKVAEEGTGGNTPSGSGLEIKTFDIASTTENQMVELAHNLGTRDVVVQIFENSQSSNYQQVFADVYYVDTAKVAINFGAAQTVPHRVIIMG